MAAHKVKSPLYIVEEREEQNHIKVFEALQEQERGSFVLSRFSSNKNEVVRISLLLIA